VGARWFSGVPSELIITQSLCKEEGWAGRVGGGYRDPRRRPRPFANLIREGKESIRFLRRMQTGPRRVGMQTLDMSLQGPRRARLDHQGRSGGEELQSTAVSAWRLTGTPRCPATKAGGGPERC